MDNIKVTIENDDVFVCDNCRNEKRIVTSFQDTVMFIYVFVKNVSTKY